MSIQSQDRALGDWLSSWDQVSMNVDSTTRATRSCPRRSLPRHGGERAHRRTPTLIRPDWTDGSDQKGQNTTGRQRIPTVLSPVGQAVGRVVCGHRRQGVRDDREIGCGRRQGYDRGRIPAPAGGRLVRNRAPAGIAVTRTLIGIGLGRALLAGGATLARVREDSARAKRRPYEQGPASQEDGHDPLHTPGL